MKIFNKFALILLSSTLMFSVSACSSENTESEAGEINTEVSADTGNTEMADESETVGESVEETENEAETVAAVYADVPVKEVELSESDENYWSEMYSTELYNMKLIRNIPTAYETTQWEDYCNMANVLTGKDPASLTESDQELLTALKNTRTQLTQIKPFADCAWFIWEENIPIATDISDYEYTVSTQDNEDFEPFLVPYLCEDQSAVKGNIIVVAGGGYSSRANTVEGYPIAEAFCDRDYNCFVLQRRVEPYGEKEAWMDMQRSIRYIRANGGELELGGLDCIIGCGFSGGSATVLGTVDYLYGDVMPTIYDEDYTPDTVDQESSDLDIALCLYGPNYETVDGEFQGLVTDNPNIPAMLLVAGENDSTARDNMILYDSIADKTIVEMYTFAENPHGFGTGIAGTNSVKWIDLADTFIQQADISIHDDTIEVVENIEYGTIPEKYTKYQTYTAVAAFGEVEINCAVNEDETAYLIFFEAFGDEQVIAGTILDGTVVVRYDRTGFFTSDAQIFYDAHDPQGWEPVPEDYR